MESSFSLRRTRETSSNKLTVSIQEDAAATKIDLSVTDPETDMYTMVVTKLPGKGKLFYANADGSKGAEVANAPTHAHPHAHAHAHVHAHSRMRTLRFLR